MFAPVSLGMIAALLALALSLLARRRRRAGRLELDDVVIAGALHAGLIGLAATLLAWLGWFSVASMAGAGVLLAGACWPWRSERDETAQGDTAPRALGLTLVLLGLLAVGVGLRLPPISAELGGRDQGTYVLRAHASSRTGSLGWTDPVLAAAGSELANGTAGPGTYDVLGLYPRTDETWRRDWYDAAYRPGAYLGDREAGEVVPQFFHLHPMLLAVAGAALGPDRVVWVLPWLAALWLACLACCARRIWPRGPWAAVAVALVVGSPLAIWTARTPLSENPMALFWWTGVLIALRMRDGVERERAGGLLIAACLGLCAFTRGNALLLLPIVLAIAWLRPRASSFAGYVLLGSLLASVVVHSVTTYPYVNDELLRRLPSLRLDPLALIGMASIGALAWVAVDQWMARRPNLGRALAYMPRVLALACIAAAIVWWWLRHAAPPGPPFSRLDAAPILLGLPLLATAGIGVAWIAWRWRPTPEQFWLVALASMVPATALLYAPRQLPTLAFFYYGRYLVPELLPAAAFAATAVFACTAARFEGRLAKLACLAAALGLVAWSVRPLIEHPQLRLREYEGASRAVEQLAAIIPADAIVIAGGEGWHSGHTNNQIGGALAFSHGVEVLPYRTREDAWVTAWELLVAGPARRGEPPPPVFLLVNEGAHQYTRLDGKIAMLDAQLWAPFRVERATLLELFVHALTPVPDALPTRVARHELRMGLLELAVDLDALAQIEKLEYADDGSTCVSPERPLTLTIPRSSEAAHMVVIADVANEPMSRRIGEWSLSIDGVAMTPPKGLPPRARATLGPMPLPISEGPVTLEILGVVLSPEAKGPEPCPHGRVAAIYLLPRERTHVFDLDADRIETITLEPPENLGHAIVPTKWAPGRTLSRYRIGTTDPPELAGLSMRLPAGGSLSFAPIDLPESDSLDLVVTLAGTTTPTESQLHIYADDQPIATISPPPNRTTSWIADPITWPSPPPRTTIRVELDAPSGTVDLRDIALFSRPD